MVESVQQGLGIEKRRGFLVDAKAL